MTLGDALAYRGVTTGQLARLVGVNKSTVEGWARPGGMGGMSVKRLRTICEMLDCGVLVTEDGAEVELYGGGNNE